MGNGWYPLVEPDGQSLIAWVGPRDPFHADVVDGLEIAGPVLRAVRSAPPSRVLLLALAEDEEALSACGEAIRAQGGDVEVEAVVTGVLGGGTTGDLTACLHSWWHGGSRQRAPGCTVLVPGDRMAESLALLAACAACGIAGRYLRTTPASLAGALHVTWPEMENPFQAGDLRAGRVREPRAAYGRSVDEPLTGSTPAEAAPSVQAVLERHGILAEAPTSSRVVQQISTIAEHDVPVLLQGETGTGKSLFARVLHDLSNVRAGPFVSVNCAAIPELLIESHLFGHCRGAFTGAVEDRPGRFDRADGGTLFLDEIGDLPTALQPKLLTVLEDGIVEPVGGDRGHAVRVRIVAASNRDLRKAVGDGTFREDLYYRLSFSVIDLPPLRERRSEIPALAARVLSRLNASLRFPRRFSPGAIKRLVEQPWRGNIRDLENVIGRSVLLSAKETVEAADLLIEEFREGEDGWAGLPEPHAGFSLEAYLAGARRQLLLRALDITGGNRSAAARLLGISAQAVQRFVRGEEGKG